MAFQDHFSTQAKTYAQARPHYPAGLFEELARLAPGRTLAWDAGAGNGQASVALAAHFERVIATEPSEAQLAAAVPHPRVEYRRSAELLPGAAGGSVDLVTVAQAAHWFDRPAFYAEARRVLRPGGVIALWVYELCHITPEIDAVVYRFYKGPIGPYWPPERRHTETGYREFEFPFAEFPFPSFAMEHDWTLSEFAAYLRSWSAVNRFSKEHRRDPVDALEAELAPLWGGDARRISWPLSGRIGRV
ncbi:MAG TPA: class I SAM-dependent methyltransferase [Lacunisphaera sp.]|jgi:SAM-dependent methyltransferase|nr:class I SAM-dependent methyltransferase [Lacunisphaera sp.]